MILLFYLGKSDLSPITNGEAGPIGNGNFATIDHGYSRSQDDDFPLLNLVVLSHILVIQREKVTQTRRSSSTRPSTHSPTPPRRVWLFGDLLLPVVLHRTIFVTSPTTQGAYYTTSYVEVSLHSCLPALMGGIGDRSQ